MRSLELGLPVQGACLHQLFEDTNINNFRKIDWAMNKAQIKNSVISIIPSHLIMMIAMTSLTLLIFYKSFGDGSLVDSLPIIGGLILGAQKLIPQLQIVYSSWTKAQGNYKIIEEVLIVLNKFKSNIKIKSPFITKMPFNKEIRVNSLSFKHQNSKKNIFENVSFHIKKNQIIGISGSTGCGKSTLSRTILQLLSATSGSINFRGQDLIQLSKKEMRLQRRHLQMIFQDPQASLNPLMTVGESIAEPLIIHNLATKRQAQYQAHKMLETVKLSPADDYYHRYPKELSGGQQQRIAIARALITKPSLVICDEPVSMLDVCVQEEILDLMFKLKNDFNLTYLFITHDLLVARYFCNKIAVMKQGKILEINGIYALPLSNPRNV